MAKITTFIIPLSVSLAGNASGLLQYPVPQNAILHIEDWQWLSTGAFSLFQVSDNTGYPFTSASQTTPILSTMLPKLAVANDDYAKMPISIDLEGGFQFLLGVLDTSGSTNAINVLLRGRIEYPALS